MNIRVMYFFSTGSVPDWAQKLLTPGGALEKFSEYWLQLNTGTTEMKRLKSGFLLRDILDRFKSKAESKIPNERMAIFSGHDMTIASLLNTMGLYWVIFIFHFRGNQFNYYNYI